MGKSSQLMRAHRKIQENQEKERQEKAESFLALYKKVVEETGIEWTAELEITPRGIVARLRLAEAKPDAEVKSWADAKKENLEIRKNCTHKKSEEEGARSCKVCGLDEALWGENGVGATEEYIARIESKIKEIEQVEARKNEVDEEELGEDEDTEEMEDKGVEEPTEAQGEETAPAEETKQ